MTLHIQNGGTLTVPRGTRITQLREALRRMGYRPISGPRGRLLLQRLH